MLGKRPADGVAGDAKRARKDDDDDVGEDVLKARAPPRRPDKASEMPRTAPMMLQSVILFILACRVKGNIFTAQEA